MDYLRKPSLWVLNTGFAIIAHYLRSFLVTVCSNKSEFKCSKRRITTEQGPFWVGPLILKGRMKERTRALKCIREGAQSSLPAALLLLLLCHRSIPVRPLISHESMGDCVNLAKSLLFPLRHRSPTQTHVRAHTHARTHTVHECSH